jgi:hypothetical protein
LCLLLATASVLFALEAAPVVALALAVGAGVAWAVGRPSLRRLSPRRRAEVWGWSLVVLAALLTLAVVVAVQIGVSASSGVVVTLGLAVLAGMAVPLNFGGWGPREIAGAFAALLVAAPASTGVAIAAGYGLLSMVSVLPGFVVLGKSWLTGTIGRGSHQVDLHARVLAQDESAGRPT